jgi:hypothetical protein
MATNPFFSRTGRSAPKRRPPKPKRRRSTPPKLKKTKKKKLGRLIAKEAISFPKDVAKNYARIAKFALKKAAELKKRPKKTTTKKPKKRKPRKSKPVRDIHGNIIHF